MGHSVLAFPCFWGSFAILCLCKESCASTVHGTVLALLGVLLQLGGEQTS